MNDVILRFASVTVEILKVSIDIDNERRRPLGMQWAAVSELAIYLAAFGVMPLVGEIVGNLLMLENLFNDVVRHFQIRRKKVELSSDTRLSNPRILAAY